MKEVQEQLFALQDLKYRDFHSKLMPNISKENVIGIRVRFFVNLPKILQKIHNCRISCRNCHINIMKRTICICCSLRR